MTRNCVLHPRLVSAPTLDDPAFSQSPQLKSDNRAIAPRHRRRRSRCTHARSNTICVLVKLDARQPQLREGWDLDAVPLRVYLTGEICLEAGVPDSARVLPGEQRE